MTKVDTKEEILKTGLRYLRRLSFNSFSFGDIAKEMGIKKSSIHYHFPTKDVLGVALVQYYHQRIKSYINQIDPGLTASEQLDLFIDFFKVGLEKKYLCPAGVLAVEFFTLSQEMQDELKLLFNYYQTWLAGICRMGIETGEFTFQGDPKTMAFHISTAIQGATSIARAYETPDLYNNSLDVLLSGIMN